MTVKAKKVNFWQKCSSTICKNMDHFETNFASPWNFFQKNLRLKFPMFFFHFMYKWDPCQFLGYTFVSKISILMYLYICEKKILSELQKPNFKVKTFLNKIISRDVYCLCVSSFLTCHIAILALQKKSHLLFCFEKQDFCFWFLEKKTCSKFSVIFFGIEICMYYS